MQLSQYSFPAFLLSPFWPQFATEWFNYFHAIISLLSASLLFVIWFEFNVFPGAYETWTFLHNQNMNCNSSLWIFSYRMMGGVKNKNFFDIHRKLNSLWTSSTMCATICAQQCNDCVSIRISDDELDVEIIIANQK